MDVLTDATSLIMSFELVKGFQRPTALNMFELARFVEAIILNESVTILDTSSDGSAEEQQIEIALREFDSECVTVRKMSVYDIITKYVDRSVPNFSRDLARGSEFGVRCENDRLYDPVVKRIDSLILEADQDKLTAYAALLTEIGKVDKSPRALSFWESLIKPEQTCLSHEWAELTERRPDRSDFWHGRFGPSRGSVLDSTENQNSVFDVYCQIYRLCDPSGGSAFAQWGSSMRGKYADFAQSMFSRSNLYILAGELLAKPYRPGALRWPICWNHFTKRQVVEASVTDAFARLAEKLRGEQQQRVKTLLGNGTMSFTIPLFLDLVLKESTTPNDILSKAVALRKSNEAVRFRKYAGILTKKVEDGDFADILRDFSDCSDRLSKALGLSNSSATWTFLSAPSLAMSPARHIDPTASVRVAGSTLADLGKATWNWWKGRRYGLVVKAAKSATSGKAMSAQIQKVFKHAINDSEWQLLARLEAFGSEKAS